jgi:hypothetical protein
MEETMRLPKTSKNKKRMKHGICQMEGCGKEFLGHPIAKYCDLHRDPKNRNRKKKIIERPDVKNQDLNHKVSEVTDMEFVCKLIGCNEKFRVMVYPRQYIYPKYCPNHRSEYRRQNFTRMLRLKKEQSI